MRKIVGSFILLVMLVGMMGSAPAPAAQVLDQEVSVGSDIFPILNVAQTFTAGKTGRIYEIELFVRKAHGSVTGLVTVELIRGESLDGEILGSVTVNASDFSFSSGSWFSFKFPEGVYVEEGQKYLIRANHVNPAAPNNPGGIILGHTSNVYSGGRGYYLNQWRDSYDYSFRTYVTPEPNDTLISTQGITFATYGDAVNLAGVLTSEGTGLLNKSVTFLVNDNSIGSATTNASGVALLNYIVNLPAGSYTIEVAFGGDAEYMASSTEASLVVEKAPLSVAASNATRVYGEANPVFSGTLTGVVNGDAITAAYTTEANEASAAGTYAIVPQLSDPDGKLANYEVSQTEGELTVTKAPLTVAASDATRVYGEANPTLGGTLTGVVNGDAITAAYSTEADEKSAAGTYAIVLQLSDPDGKLMNYEVSQIEGELTVTKAPLTVTPSDATRVYGEANPVFSGTLTGVVNGDEITAAYTTEANEASAAGTYAIVPQLSDPDGKLANYEVSQIEGELTVTKAPLTVTASDATRVYGEANPAFSGTLTGVVNGDAITAAYSTEANEASAAGTYAIVPQLSDPDGKLANYEVSQIEGELMVTKAPLTVTASDATRVYGEANPTLGGTLTGVVNGDAITAAYSTEADEKSASGTYAIVPQLSDPGGKLANYEVSQTEGELTVTKAPLTVAASDATRVYGEANPTLGGTLTGVVNGDPITATYTTVADEASATGTYAIVPQLSDPEGKLANYEVSQIEGELTVTKAPLTVAASDATRVYGEANPTLGGTLTGVVNGDAITAAYSTEADEKSAAGTYAIVLQLSDPDGKLMNYEVSQTEGELTVTKAPLTVTASDATRVYGEANPTLGGTLTGVVNGDAITAAYSTEADEKSAAGTYAIVPQLSDPEGKLANYEVSQTEGELTVTKAPLTVTASDATRVYGEANPAFSGTLTGVVNGDEITAAYSTEADEKSASGTYAIVPQLSDPEGKLANYDVSQTEGELTVRKASLTVTASDATRVYGEANPTLGGTLTGVVNGDPITATYTTAADEASAPGTYAIVPQLSDPEGKLANYDVSQIEGELTVTKAPLTVAASDATRVYGEANPGFDGTLIGVVNGDRITATYTTAADEGSAAGTYAIVPQLSDPEDRLANYDVSQTEGELTVTKAPLTVTASDATRVYGEANPTLGGTLTGLVNGDRITATYTTAANEASAAGTYAIVSQLSDPDGKLMNYEVSQTEGELTVTKAPLTVTASDATRVYGEANPAFSGTLTGVVNGDPITATYTTVADEASATGTYAIVPQLSDPQGKLANYDVSQTEGELTVTKAPLTVTASDATRVYGEANPAFSGTLTGVVNGDAITAAYSTEADEKSATGTYAIVPQLSDPEGKLANYEVSQNEGELTVTKAPLTVMASDATRVYGEANPAFSGTLTGVVNGDPIIATYTTEANEASAVGTYAIVSQLSDPDGKLMNYEVSQTEGELTITKAPLTVTPADVMRWVGFPNPSLKGEVTGWVNGDTAEVVYQTEAGEASEAGAYVITAEVIGEDAVLANYDQALHTGTLLVYPAPEIGFVEGDSPAAVTMNLELPAADAQGVPVTWTTTDAASIQTNGTVARPNYDKAPVDVTVTASVQIDGVDYAQEYELTVLPIVRVLQELRFEFDDEADAFRLYEGQRSPMLLQAVYDLGEPEAITGEASFTITSGWVARIDEDGNLVGLREGRTKLEAAYGGLTTEVAIIVNANAVILPPANPPTNRPFDEEAIRSGLISLSVEADTLRLAAGAIQEAIALNPDVVLAVTAGMITHYVPASVLDIEGWATASDLNREELQIQFILEQASESPALPTGKARILTNTFTFGVRIVNEAGEAYDVEGFEDYIETTWTLGNVPGGSGNGSHGGSGRGSAGSAGSGSPGSGGSDPSGEERHLTVWRWDEASAQFVFVPARFEQTDEGTVAILQRRSNGRFIIVEQTAAFSDTAAHWARAPIEQLAAKGIIKGRSAERFDPGSPITRAEISALLVRALGLTGTNSSTMNASTSNEAVFADVQNGWYVNPVQQAFAAGLIAGDGNGAFRPDAAISRQELAMVLRNAIALVRPDLLDEAAAERPFNDADEIAPWASAAVQLAAQLGLMEGTPEGGFEPARQATRAETVLVLQRLLQRFNFI